MARGRSSTAGGPDIAAIARGQLRASRRCSTGLPLSSDDRANGNFRPGAVAAPRRHDIEEAIAFVNAGAYGNQASCSRSSGANARQFRYEAEVGNVGINVGVAAPMAFFPFSGARESFFGDLHGQGRDAIEFFTQEKVVVERWPKAWTRRF